MICDLFLPDFLDCVWVRLGCFVLLFFGCLGFACILCLVSLVCFSLVLVYVGLCFWVCGCFLC